MLDDLPANIHADHLIDANTYSTLWYSDGQGIPSGDSGFTCVMCHNPHGDRLASGAPTETMTHAGFGVAHAVDNVGPYGTLTSGEWYANCSFDCHWGGQLRWYQRLPPQVLSVTLYDNDPADPAPAMPGYTNSPTVSVVISAAADPTEMMLAEDAAFTVNPTAWLPFAGTTTYTVTGGNGVREVYVRLRNADGQSAGLGGTIQLDTTAPDVPGTALTVPNGGEVWDQGAPYDVTWNVVSDVLPGVLGDTPIAFAYSLDGSSYVAFHDALGQPLGPEANDGTFSWALPVVESTSARVRLTATDQAGNQSSDISNGNFTIRSVVPLIGTFTVVDANPADPAQAEPTFTNARQVAVSITASRYPTQMNLAEDAAFTQNSTGWIPYAASTTYDLSDSDGPKTVYLRLRNTAGVSGSASSAITLDRELPRVEATALTFPNGAERVPEGTSAGITWEAGVGTLQVNAPSFTSGEAKGAP